MSQASGDAVSVVSKTEEPARASSVSADEEPETSGAHSNAAPQDTPHSRSRVQVSSLNLRNHKWSLSTAIGNAIAVLSPKLVPLEV